MKTDIQIAQEATMLPIKDVAANYVIIHINGYLRVYASGMQWWDMSASEGQSVNLQKMI